MAVEHWMTFATFGEQEFFTYPGEDTYQGVILNANMVAHAPAGIAAFLLGKVSPSAGFLIDPMTHAFQHAPETISNENGPKSSIKTLAQQFGGPIADCVGVRPLSPKDFYRDISDVTRRVLDFQWNYLKSHFQDNEDAKYLEENEVVRRPAIIVAPYFYVTEDNRSEWLPVNSAAAQEAINQRGHYDDETKIYSAVVVDRAMIQRPEYRDELVDAFSGLGLDGVLLWVDEFDEVGATALELEGFASLCKALRSLGLEVLNLHGGYFSCLLASDAFELRLTGVSHGPEFGESRGVVPVGGGIPISRFYVPDLHIRSKFRDFVPVAIRKGWLESAAAFHSNVCDCHECRIVLNGRVENFQLYGESEVKSIKRRHGVVRIEFPTTEAKKRCLRHYLNNKAAEFGFVNVSNRTALLENLSKSYEKFTGAESAETISHLQRWRSVLERI